MNTATKLHVLPTAEVVEQKETALAVIPEAKVTDIFLKGEGIDELLAACEEKAMAITADASTAKGRAEIKSMAYLVTRTKTAFDVPGKALSAEYKEKPRTIDANRKKVADYLEDLQKRVRKPLTDWEEAEKARIKAIEDRLDSISKHVFMADNAEFSSSVKEMIARIEGIEIDESFAEFKEDAKITKNATLAKLYAVKDALVRREAEVAELARLREEQAKRDQEEREAKIAQEAAEKATREANEKAAREKAESEARELRAKLAQEQAEKAAEQAKADAEAKAKQVVEDELHRQEEAKAKAEAEEAARLADEDNRWRVHSEILEDLESIGCGEAVARELLTALINGQVRNTKIIY
jgi:hypothetical protein